MFDLCVEPPVEEVFPEVRRDELLLTATGVRDAVFSDTPTVEEEPCEDRHDVLRDAARDEPREDVPDEDVGSRTATPEDDELRELLLVDVAGRRCDTAEPDDLEDARNGILAREDELARDGPLESEAPVRVEIFDALPRDEVLLRDATRLVLCAAVRVGSLARDMAMLRGVALDRDDTPTRDDDLVRDGTLARDEDIDDVLLCEPCEDVTVRPFVLTDDREFTNAWSHVRPGIHLSDSRLTPL